MTKFSGVSDRTGYWTAPAKVTPEEIMAARHYCNAVLAARPPVEMGWLRSRCGALLAHFFINLSDARLNAMVAADWLNILSPFPEKVIASAMRQWLEKTSDKPKPHDIRELCISVYGITAWKNYERARVIAEMMPSAQAATPAAANEQPAEDYTKSDEKRAKIAETMHNAKLPHSPTFCPICKKESAQ